VSEYKIAIVDRHAGYVPEIEQSVLARSGASVEVSWSKVAQRPPQADVGAENADEARALSRITSGFVPPSITTEDRVIDMARDADGILCVRADITAKVMDALPRLKVVGRYGIGLDNVDTAAAAERGVAVVYAPGFCAREVADHTMAMLLACSRKLEPLHRGMLQGTWGRDAASPMRALYSQTLGLVGLGQIGRAVAARAKAFGLRVLAFDPAVDSNASAALGVELVPLDTLIEASDYVSLHVPLTSATRHIIDAQRLARMKSTAFLINTSRGPLVDEPALATALAQRKIAGAALDVFEREPLPESSPLVRLDNVLLSPHIGGLSDEAQVELREIVATAMSRVLDGRWPTGPELYSPRTPAEQARSRAVARRR
jgi:D-3-phosphoglycerate dehydrogenase